MKATLWRMKDHDLEPVLHLEDKHNQNDVRRWHSLSQISLITIAVLCGILLVPKYYLWLALDSLCGHSGMQMYEMLLSDELISLD